MPTLRLTRTNIEKIPNPEQGQVLYRDDQLMGFGLRVGVKTKVFFVERQFDRRNIRTTIGRFGELTPEEARKAAMTLLSDIASGVNPNQVKREEDALEITVERAFELFFEARVHLRPSSVDNYKRSPKLYLKEWCETPIVHLTRRMILAKHREISEKHGAVTANNAMRHLRSVYNFISSTQDEFPPNPVDIMRLARAWAPERRRRTLIPVQKLPAWWQAVLLEEDYARDFLIMALFTGMRRNEITSLKWEYIDFIEKMLHVPRTKNGDPLDLPLSDYLLNMLLQRQEAVGQSEWVFPGIGVTGHVIESKKILRRVVERSGVPFTLHDLRRTFITIAESLDIPAYALKRLLNHRTNSDVTGGYIIMDAERLRAPVERIAQRILEIVKDYRG
jgi:integrase